MRTAMIALGVALLVLAFGTAALAGNHDTDTAQINVTVNVFGMVRIDNNNWSFQLVGQENGNVFRFSDSDIPADYKITVRGNAPISVTVSDGTVAWNNVTYSPVYTFALPDGTTFVYDSSQGSSGMYTTAAATGGQDISLTQFYIDVNSLTDLPANATPSGTLTVTIAAAGQ